MHYVSAKFFSRSGYVSEDILWEPRNVWTFSAIVYVVAPQSEYVNKIDKDILVCTYLMAAVGFFLQLVQIYL